MAIQSKKIRQSAKGEECTLMFHPYSCTEPETTVFCHMPSPDNGVGLKASHDFWGAYGCAACHRLLDNVEKHGLDPVEFEKCKQRGIYRTQKKLIEKGLLTYRQEKRLCLQITKQKTKSKKKA